MDSFRKYFVVVVIVITLGLSCPARTNHARIRAHIVNCVEHDFDGNEIKGCFISVARVNATGQVDFGSSYREDFYVDSRGKINAVLSPGSYRVELYSAHARKWPAWTKIITVAPGATLDLGELDVGH